MPKFKNIIFDFDGTLFDTRKGIINCLKYTYTKIEKTPPNSSRILEAVGKSLYDMFSDLLQSNNDNSIRNCMRIFREEYSRKGVFESELFPHIEEMLKSLKEHKKRMIIVTSKPELFVIKLLKKFSIEKYFDSILAIKMEDIKFDKHEVIKEWLEENKIRKEDAVIVGDRGSDFEAGKSNNIFTIGVSFGYGTPEELARADKVFNNVISIKDYLV